MKSQHGLVQQVKNNGFRTVIELNGNISSLGEGKYYVEFRNRHIGSLKAGIVHYIATFKDFRNLLYENLEL